MVLAHFPMRCGLTAFAPKIPFASYPRMLKSPRERGSGDGAASGVLAHFSLSTSFLCVPPSSTTHTSPVVVSTI